MIDETVLAQSYHQTEVQLRIQTTEEMLGVILLIIMAQRIFTRGRLQGRLILSKANVL